MARNALWKKGGRPLGCTSCSRVTRQLQGLEPAWGAIDEQGSFRSVHCGSCRGWSLCMGRGHVAGRLQLQLAKAETALHRAGARPCCGEESPMQLPAGTACLFPAPPVHAPVPPCPLQRPSHPALPCHPPWSKRHLALRCCSGALPPEGASRTWMVPEKGGPQNRCFEY